MKSGNNIPISEGLATALFDTDVAKRILRADGGIDWPSGTNPRDVHIERGWPMRQGGFVVEWSFRLGSGPRFTLFGTQYDHADGFVRDDTKSAIVTKNGIRGVLVQLPEWGVRIHSIDCDEAMPHLARCLDDGEMAKRLFPLWSGGIESNGDGPGKVECVPLSYRVGRRAAISYRAQSSSHTPGRLLGKTYCDGRGERLLRLHEELDGRLASATDGRVRVPKALEYFDDLQLALFAWVRGEATGPGAAGVRGMHDEARLAVEGLAALHSVTVPGLADFTITDECAIIARWQAVLALVNPERAERTHDVAETLLSVAESFETQGYCTVHRDFYDGQFVYDGHTITLLDLDTLAKGDPCVDLGNLLAHMYLASLRVSAPVEEFESAARIIISEYMNNIATLSGGSRKGTDEGRRLNRQLLAFYWASALFRVGAVHTVRTSSGRFAPSLWQLAGELLAELSADRSAGSSASDGQIIVPNPREILKELSS